MPERIGVEAVFRTGPAFNRGLSAYITGLNQAIRQTREFVTAFSRMSVPVGRVTSQTNQAIQQMLPALQQLGRVTAQAAQTAARGVGGAAAPDLLSQLRDELQLRKIITQEVRDRGKEERLLNNIISQRSGLLERERAQAQLAEIDAAREVRTERFRQLGGDPQDLERIRQLTLTVAEAEQKVLIPLEAQIQIQKLISREVEDRIRLARLEAQLQDRNLSILERRRLVAQQQQLLAERAQRTQQISALGGSPQDLERIRRMQVAARDLGQEQESVLDRQIRLQNILEAELRDRIEEERARLILANRTATAYQRQQAALALQRVGLQRAARQPELRAAGAGVDAARIRALTVAQRDLQQQTLRTTHATQGLTRAAVAQGVALGVTVVAATRAVIAAFGIFARQVVETVTFFERLELSIEFYSVRALRATNQTVSYAQAIDIVREEAQGTLIWLQRLAVASPFTTRDVGTLFRTSQAYGLLREEALKLTPLLLDFAAAAGLDSDILERLALAIGQVRSRGKLTGEEVRQLGNSGIPIRDILVKALNIANEEFDELLEAGAFTSDVVIPAVIKALKEFEGAGRRVAFETIGGIISAFKELSEIGIFQLFKGIVQPIKQQFLDLFEVLNQPGILAFLRVLGTEIGQSLSTALRNVGAAIKVVIKGWREMDPVLKRQIVAFFLASAAVTALAASLGIFFLALSVLTKPFVLLGIAVTTLVAAWGAGFKSIAEITVSTGKLITSVFGGISKVIQTLFKGRTKVGPTSPFGIFADQIAEGAEEGANKAAVAIEKGIDEGLDKAAGNALIAGSLAGANFLKGWQLPNPAERISKELQDALNRFGSGPQLGKASAEAIDNFFSAFKDMDFSFLNQIGGNLQAFLRNAVDLGEIQESELPSLLFGGRQAVAQAIDEFRRLGVISQRAMVRVRRAVGDAGGSVVRFLEIYQNLARATDATTAAQEKLNSISEKYKAIITPIRKELEAINEARRQGEERLEILELERTLANEAVSEARKEAARARIREIEQEQSLRRIEGERDAKQEAAEEELTAAQKIQKEFQDELDLLQARTDARQAQLDLVGQEASLFRSIQEEINRLREKEKTTLEKQLELLKLMDEEVKSLVDEAEARFTLNSADSTELEKQLALLQLQNIALGRQQRLIDVEELGFDSDILRNLADIPITLKDIGESTDKVASPFADIEGLTEDLGFNTEGLIELTEEWEEALAEAKARWTEIKTEIGNTLTTINENFPEFLRFLPEEGETEPPIIGTIRKYKNVLIGFAVAMVAFKVVSNILLVTSAIRGLLGLGAAGAAGGAAAAAGGGAAGFVARLVAIGGAVTRFGLVVGAAAAGVWAYYEAVKALQEVGLDLGARILEDETKTLESVGPQLDTAFDDLFDNLFKPNEALTETIRDSFRTLISDGIKQGVDEEEIGAQIQRLSENSLARGFIADTPTNRALLKRFQSDVVALFAATDIGGQVATVTQEKLDGQLPAIQEKTNTVLSQMGAELDPALFAEDINNYIDSALAAGVSPEEIQNTVEAMFNEGVAAGLAKPGKEVDKAIKNYTDGIFAELKIQTESQSPSRRAAREVGVPVGQGVVKGMESQIILIKTSTVITDTVAFLLGRWTQVRTDAVDQMIRMKDEVLREFTSLQGTIKRTMDTIYNDVVTTGFTLISTDAQNAVTTMRTQIVALLAGPENSLVADLQEQLGATDETGIAWNIGKDFISGIAQGITDNSILLDESLREAIAGAFESTAEVLRSGSPSLEAADKLGMPLGAGIALGVENSMGLIRSSIQNVIGGALTSSLSQLQARPATMLPQSISNINRTNNYNLNVQTAAQSQGVISDFLIMQVMAGA